MFKTKVEHLVLTWYGLYNLFPKLFYLKLSFLSKKNYNCIYDDKTP